ncbi:pH-response regulator protein palH/rim21 [Pestalotiopsis sp. IQ-011]
MSPPPPTKAKVPAAADQYSSATLDSEARNEVYKILIHDGYIEKIQERLLHRLHSDPSNWPTALEQRGVELLRSGEATTFPVLIRKVLEEVRHDTQAKSSAKNGEVNGATTNGKAKAANGTGGSGDNSLALPADVIQDLVKYTKELLKEVMETDDSDDGA